MRKIFDYKPSHNYLNISSMEELKLAKIQLKGEIREKERIWDQKRISFHS